MAPRTPTAKSTMRIEPPLSHTGENMADTGTVGRFVRGRSGGAGEQRETRRTRRNEVEPSKRVREVRSKRISRGILLPRDVLRRVKEKPSRPQRWRPRDSSPSAQSL